MHKSGRNVFHVDQSGNGSPIVIAKAPGRRQPRPVTSVSQPPPSTPSPEAQDTPPPHSALAHVTWFPDAHRASVNIQSTRADSEAIAYAVQARLNESIAHTTESHGQATCAVADALLAFIAAFQLPFMTASHLIEDDAVWDALRGCEAASFELAPALHDAEGAAVRFVRLDETHPDGYKALATLLRVLLANEEIDWAVRVFGACGSSALRAQVRARLPLAHRHRFGEPGVADPGPLEPARDRPQRSRSNPIVQQEWRASRHAPPSGRHSPVRSKETSPRAGAPSHWRRSRTLSVRVDAATKAMSTLNALKDKLSPDVQTQWLLRLDANDRIDAVASLPELPLTLDALLQISERLDLSNDTAHLYLPLIATLLRHWPPELALCAPDTAPQLARALQHLQAICDTAFQGAPARGDLLAIEQAFEALGLVFDRRADPIQVRELHRSRVVGEALQKALIGGCGAPTVVCLLQLLAPIEAPGAIVRILTATAKTFTTAREALALLAPVAAFLAADDCSLPWEKQEPFTDLLLDRLPRAFMRLLVPDAPRGGSGGRNAPEDAATVARLAQWVWLASSLRADADGPQRPALAAYWRQRLADKPEARLCLRRLGRLCAATPAEDGTPGAMTDIRGQLQQQLDALPTDLKLALAFVDPGPQGLNLDEAGHFRVGCRAGWLLNDPRARHVGLRLLQWHLRHQRLAVDGALARALLHWAEAPDDTTALEFVQPLRRDRESGPLVSALFKAMLKALTQHDRDAWTPAQASVVAALARGVEPPSVTAQLIVFMGDYLGRRREASADPSAANVNLDALLPSLIPLLPLAHSAASIELLRGLSFDGPTPDQWAAIGTRLVFAHPADFEGWYQAVNLYVLDTSMLEMLSAWLMTHPMLDRPSGSPGSPGSQASLGPLRLAVSGAHDRLLARQYKPV